MTVTSAPQISSLRSAIKASSSNAPIHAPADEPDAPKSNLGTNIASNSAGERFVLVSQSLVIVAFAVGLSVHAGWHPFFAGSAAVAVVIALFSFNRLLAARQGSVAPVVDPIPQSQAPHEFASQPRPPIDARPAHGHDMTGTEASPGAAAVRPLSLNAADLDIVSLEASIELARAGVAANEPPTLASSELDQAPSGWLPQPIAATAPVNAAERVAGPPPLPRQAYPAFSPEVPVTPVTLRNSYASEMPRYSPVETTQDYWGHRPSRSRATEHVQADPVFAAQPVLETALHDAGALRETDVEAIQSLIKKLADEVNSAEHIRGDTLALTPERPAFEPEHALAQSLDALRVAAETMRAPSHQFFGHELPPAIPVTLSRAAILAQAIADGRADVLLEPILGLQNQDAQHFEVSLRLRAHDGAALDLDPSDRDLTGTGLLPLFDAAKMVRTASVARRLADRGKTGAVFSTYSGEALIDAAFRNDAAVAAQQRPVSGGPLILTFSQSDARGFQAPEWGAIAEMRAQGFRFALSEVTDLDMDLEGLVGAGFEFVKLDADVLLTGLYSPAGMIPAADVCRFLAGLGLALVVDRIDDADKFARVCGCGAALGQGQLFGGARLLKAEDGRPAGQAAA